MNLVPCLLPLFALPNVLAQTTERVSVSSTGAQGDLESVYSALSADGRYVAFESRASTLVPGDTNGTTDIFVRDRQSGTTERVSLDSNGNQGDLYSLAPSITSDGRFVAFESRAANLVPGDTNGKKDVFVRDRLLATTRRVSVDAGGLQGDGDSQEARISADGRFLAFTSSASNLVPGDTNTYRDAFVCELASGAIERVSVSSSGVEGYGGTALPAISADGRFVAYCSAAGNLVPNDIGGFSDVFVRDRQLGTTERVSVNSAGIQIQGPTSSSSISADGRWVAFETHGINLDPNDTNLMEDIYVHDRLSGITERMSVAIGGGSANGASRAPSISADGRFVAFESSATNLIGADANIYTDIYVRDRLTGTLEVVSVDSAGAQGHGQCNAPSISPDGRVVAFYSAATDLVAGDTNAQRDVFAHTLGASSPGTDLCQAGAGGVPDCPCTNPPSGSPRGCDNSSATGGAQLSSSGFASLTFDSVLLATNGEKPTATSVVLQGDAEISSGTVFGQGLRCVGGGLKRLYVKSAAGGAIAAPEPGEPSVSARSAALGDPLTAGTSRWYAVYYRDPVVLGGCPAASTFNITQTQRVDWGT
jgi:Tol biopolymer transport system component